MTSLLLKTAFALTTPPINGGATFWLWSSCERKGRPRWASCPVVSSDTCWSTNFPMNCPGGTLILTFHSRDKSRTDTSQPSRSLNMIINSLLWMKCPDRFSTNSLFWTEPIVAVGDQATTGPPFKSASHRLCSKRSRSGTTQTLAC